MVHVDKTIVGLMNHSWRFSWLLWVKISLVRRMWPWCSCLENSSQACHPPRPSISEPQDSRQHSQAKVHCSGSTWSRSRAEFILDTSVNEEMVKEKCFSMRVKAASGCMSHVSSHKTFSLSLSLYLSSLSHFHTHTHAQGFCFSLPELAQDIFFVCKTVEGKKKVSKLLSYGRDVSQLPPSRWDGNVLSVCCCCRRSQTSRLFTHSSSARSSLFPLPRAPTAFLFIPSASPPLACETWIRAEWGVSTACRQHCD